jgi:hypothetical protein
MGFLSGAINFDPAAIRDVGGLDPALMARVVAFDAFAQNMDRTAKNPNMLWCTDKLWLIDHGAALYWQHDWDGGLGGVSSPFALIARHVLLPRAGSITGQAAWLRAGLGDEAIAAAVAAVPDEWVDRAARARARGVSRGLRGPPARASRRDGDLPGGGRRCPRSWPLIMRSCGSCRGSSGRNLSTSV